MDEDKIESTSDSYLAKAAIISVIIATIGIVLLPIAPILSALALLTAIFAKRSSEPGSKHRHIANITMVLAGLLLIAEITIISSFLIKTYRSTEDAYRYPAINTKSVR